jgi:hypothetical protein
MRYAPARNEVELAGPAPRWEQAAFDLTFAPTGSLKIGKYTYEYVYAIRGYWTRDYEGGLHVR